MAEPTKEEREGAPSGKAPGESGSSTQRDVPGGFRDGLESIEALLDEVQREVGGPSAAATGQGSMLVAAEGFLELYARLRRVVVGSADPTTLRGEYSGSADAADSDAELRQLITPLLRFLYQSWWRVDLQGVENIPGDGPLVLAVNTSGGLFGYDAAMLHLGLQEEHLQRRPPCFLLDDSLMKLPVVGELLAACGAVCASEDNGDALLAGGAMVACFPEGREALGREFQKRYRVEPFPESWFVRMALRSGAQILPVAIVGAEEAHPVLAQWDWLARRVGVPFFPLTPTFPLFGLGGVVPLPSRWRIEIGRPIELSPASSSAPWEDSRFVRRSARHVRDRLQILVDSALSRRGAAFCWPGGSAEV